MIFPAGFVASWIHGCVLSPFFPSFPHIFHEFSPFFFHSFHKFFPCFPVFFPNFCPPFPHVSPGFFGLETSARCERSLAPSRRPTRSTGRRGCRRRAAAKSCPACCGSWRCRTTRRRWGMGWGWDGGIVISYQEMAGIVIKKKKKNNNKNKNPEQGD